MLGRRCCVGHDASLVLYTGWLMCLLKHDGLHMTADGLLSVQSLRRHCDAGAGVLRRPLLDELGALQAIHCWPSAQQPSFVLQTPDLMYHAAEEDPLFGTALSTGRHQCCSPSVGAQPAAKTSEQTIRKIVVMKYRFQPSLPAGSASCTRVVDFLPRRPCHLRKTRLPQASLRQASAHEHANKL